MSKFQITQTFELPNWNAFILEGMVVEGNLRPGMFMRFSFNWQVWLSLRIGGIEGDGRKVLVDLECELEEAQLLRELKLDDRVVTVTENEF